MIKVEFSKEEVQALLQLIDMAVKTGGLNVAEAGVVLARKIDKAGAEVTNNKPLEVEK